MIQDFIEKHGKHALKMHVFRTGEETTPNEKLPSIKHIEGKLVMVKSNDEHLVELLDMESENTFHVSMAEYKKRCNNNWMLDEALMIHDPKEWERQSTMVRNAYKACGLDV